MSNRPRPLAPALTSVTPRLASPSSAEPIGVLLLPTRLEDFSLSDHARELLQIPRVVALEASRHRTPRILRESAPARQARRLRLPGVPHLLVLYHPGQYRLARALLARYTKSELWYVRPAETDLDEPELAELDNLAAERAGEDRLLAPDPSTAQPGGPLRSRMQELGIITHRPFFPGARVSTR